MPILRRAVSLATVFGEAWLTMRQPGSRREGAREISRASRSPGVDDQAADRFGQLVAEREPQVAAMAVIGGRVRRAGRIGADQDLDALVTARSASKSAVSRTFVEPLIRPGSGGVRVLDRAVVVDDFS